jgi:hypothetical protein
MPARSLATPADRASTWPSNRAIDGVEYRLNDGDAIFFAGDCVHAFRNRSSKPCEYYLAMDVRVARPGTLASQPTPQPGGTGMATEDSPRHERDSESPTFSGMDAEQFRQIAHLAVDLAADYLSSMRNRPVFMPLRPEERQALLEQPLPAYQRAPEKILESFRRDILPHPMGNGHPRFFGWVNSPPAPMGIVAEFLSAAMNPSCAGGDHAAITWSERWFAGSRNWSVFPSSPRIWGCLLVADRWLR